MKISEAFPSKYIKAADLQDKPVTLAMKDVIIEKVGDDQKPILYFKGTDKGLVLNKTNSNNIAAIYGDDTDEWIGQRITLVSTMVDFQGKSTEAIRVKSPPRVAPAERAAPPPRTREDDMDDGRDIPF